MPCPRHALSPATPSPGAQPASRTPGRGIHSDRLHPRGTVAAGPPPGRMRSPSRSRPGAARGPSARCSGSVTIAPCRGERGSGSPSACSTSRMSADLSQAPGGSA
eukprot:scaffold3383_cov412-Prasinococcus_capsulatus_cf.AAC.5